MKRRYDYYTVEIPNDLGDERTKAEAAIETAEERTKLFVVPATWTATKVGETTTHDIYKVCRRRNS